MAENQESDKKEEIVEITVLVEQDGYECLYINGTHWGLARQSMVYVTDIAGAASGRLIRYRYASVEFDGVWPEDLIDILPPTSPPEESQEIIEVTVVSNVHGSSLYADGKLRAGPVRKFIRPVALASVADGKLMRLETVQTICDGVWPDLLSQTMANDAWVKAHQ